MNYLFAFALFWAILVFKGTGTFQPVIGEVDPESLGQQLGLMSGDRVLSVGEQEVSTWDDIFTGLLRNESQRTTLVVQRNGRREELPLDLPSLSSQEVENLGIAPFSSTRVGIVEKGGPAYLAGIREGDVIEAVDSVAVERWSQMAQLIQAKPDSVISIRWRRGSQVHQAQVRTIAVKMPDEEDPLRLLGFVGITSEIFYKKIGVLSAAGQSVHWTLEITRQIAFFIKGLVTREVSIRMVGGPIFIAQVAGQTARQGFPFLLTLMSMLSVNLALLNVLPIPLLDGGQLLVLLIESLKGHSLSNKQRMVVQQVGLVMITMLLALVLFNDLTRLAR